jgi:hypothetical protein
MKSIKTSVSFLFFTAAVGLSTAPAAHAAGVIAKDVFGADSYCHLKFPAIEEKTLGTPHPVLKDPGSGDIIDFYGPCHHDPLGEDEIRAQLLQQQHRWQRDYMN